MIGQTYSEWVYSRRAVIAEIMMLNYLVLYKTTNNERLSVDIVCIFEIFLDTLWHYTAVNKVL